VEHAKLDKKQNMIIS